MFDVIDVRQLGDHSGGRGVLAKAQNHAAPGPKPALRDRMPIRSIGGRGE
jgi:hypothetical protein